MCFVNINTFTFEFFLGDADGENDSPNAWFLFFSIEANTASCLDGNKQSSAENGTIVIF